jgi:hypothetical protein
MLKDVEGVVEITVDVEYQKQINLKCKNKIYIFFKIFLKYKNNQAQAKPKE